MKWNLRLAAALGGGRPCPGGGRRLLQVTASLAAGIPVDLRDAVTGLDGRNARLVAGAVLHASGHRDARILPPARLRPGSPGRW